MADQILGWAPGKTLPWGDESGLSHLIIYDDTRMPAWSCRPACHPEIYTSGMILKEPYNHKCERCAKTERRIRGGS